MIGKPIQSVITNTSMLEVLRKAHRGDDEYVQKYLPGETKKEGERYAIANRFCVFDENNQVIAAVAQMKFKQKTLDFAQRIFQEEFDFYKAEYKNSCTEADSFEDVIGLNPLFLELKKKARKAAKTDFPVLLTGETGTGKEVMAKAIHYESQRFDAPIISINCAAIPSELMESELFGYEEGSFTGAKKGGKKGKFELADGGTIFLDEIGDMPLNMQAKLLRVLQEKEIERIGGERPLPVDVRVIAATRKDLPDLIKKGEFREDLYYRLNVINIEMIPLRKRREDIIIFAEHFLRQLNTDYKKEIGMSNDVKKCFLSYFWPGNIRELDNVIKSAYAACDEVLIELNDLPSKMVDNHRKKDLGDQMANKKLSQIMDEYEKNVLVEVLKKYSWNCQNAADELGIHRSALYKKINKLHIKMKEEL